MKREIIWVESYSVGVRVLDEQHQTIINELNKLYFTFNSDSESNDLVTILNTLNNYSLVHFLTEENLLEKYKYHDLNVQKKEHNFYKQKIENFMQRVESEGKSVILETIGFLADWWMGHIQGGDKEYTRFLNNNGVF